ncbi:MAG: HlyC/CorC family transporter [Actinobacteria bacterium]|jgi:CBS domain containing-hemolysin-like protein|nr:HlyC/CorC family transporter [Actinomycetota bacterium]MDQ3532330.1 hemolysin family protein [Actinomycetota bacterium]
MNDFLVIAGIVLLVLIAALMTIAQSAISRMGRVRAHHLSQQRYRGSRSLQRIMENVTRFMNVVVLIKVAAQLAAAILAAGLAVNHWGGIGSIAAIVLMTLAIFVLGEVVPRTIALQHVDRVAMAAAVPVYLLGTILGPLGRVLVISGNALMVVLPGRGLPRGPFLVEEEVRDLHKGDDDDEEFEEEERELIDSIFDFGDTIVRAVMVPRPDMVTVPSGTTLDQALDTSLTAGYSRIPVYEGDSDNMVGVTYAKDLMKHIHDSSASVSLKDLARAPLFVPEQKKVAELLREMQQQHVHMAIVIDEYGGTAGLVTIEDLIEEIVGEIVDEYDQEEPLVEPIDDDTIRVDAKMQISEVNELLDADLPHEEWDTVGGLVFDLTGRVPVQGETVRYDSLEFRTERVTGRRIKKVVITRAPVETEAPAE